MPTKYAIAGSPRSGSTWLHNALIHSGRFRGLPDGDNTVHANTGLFVTDENQYSHYALLRLSSETSQVSLFVSRMLLGALQNVLATRYGGTGKFILNSPYYSFFIDTMFNNNCAQKFIYIRRHADHIALSMIRHQFLSSQLGGELDTFYSMVRKGKCLESPHVPSEILAEFNQRYQHLTPYDRALFKCLCFASAFVTLSKTIPPECSFVLDYGSFDSDRNHRDRCGDFLELNDQQRDAVLSSFRKTQVSTAILPPHDPGFRQKILEAEARLLEA
jgi:hypothetical protein